MELKRRQRSGQQQQQQEEFVVGAEGSYIEEGDNDASDTFTSRTNQPPLPQSVPSVIEADVMVSEGSKMNPVYR